MATPDPSYVREDLADAYLAVRNTQERIAMLVLIDQLPDRGAATYAEIRRRITDPDAEEATPNG